MLLRRTQFNFDIFLFAKASSVCRRCSANVINIIRVLRLRRNTHWQKYASFDTQLSPVLATGIMGKDGLFEALQLEDTWLTGSSTRAGTDCTNLQLPGSSVPNCQALTCNVLVSLCNACYIRPTISEQ